MIVKIQRPMATNAPDAECLIYNASRTYMTYVRLADVKHLFVNDVPKVYHKAGRSKDKGIATIRKEFSINASLQSGEVREYDPGGGDRIVIGVRLPDQEW